MHCLLTGYSSVEADEREDKGTRTVKIDKDIVLKMVGLTFRSIEQ